MYRRVGDVQGEANCTMSLGDIASAQGARDDAEAGYRQALALYERIADPYSIGSAHLRLAHVATDDAARASHVAAAREAWLSIGREDLVAEFLAELEEERK